MSHDIPKHYGIINNKEKLCRRALTTKFFNYERTKIKKETIEILRAENMIRIVGGWDEDPTEDCDWTEGCGTDTDGPSWECGDSFDFCETVIDGGCDDDEEDGDDEDNHTQTYVCGLITTTYGKTCFCI